MVRSYGEFKEFFPVAPAIDKGGGLTVRLNKLPREGRRTTAIRAHFRIDTGIFLLLFAKNALPVYTESIGRNERR
ncbi:MAG: hypothetical protein WC335_01450 [Candidatus Omnitrophota bacterium]